MSEVKPQSILVLGGTKFFGKRLVQKLLTEGHRVTLLTRGLNPHPFGERVEHLIADRLDENAFRKVLGERAWDVVYDQSCYHVKAARIAGEALQGRTRHYVFTSSQAVYIGGWGELTEGDFDPLTRPIVDDDTIARQDAPVRYSEMKRQSEATLTRLGLPLTAVRFPIVLGPDDYSGRLQWHIDRVRRGEPIAVPTPEQRLSFIASDEAARFLAFLADKNPLGSVNACSNGAITMADILRHIESATGRKAQILVGAEHEPLSPFARPGSGELDKNDINAFYMSNEKAKRAGFIFNDVTEWLPRLIADAATV